MTDAAFEKVSRSDKRIYGPRKLLLCGFSPNVQPKFSKLLEMLGLGDLSRVWVTHKQSDTQLVELLGLEDGSGLGAPSSLPRAVVMAGISEQELHQLMGGARKAGMRGALWATLTPTSENWTMGNLLAELSAEREAMQKKTQ